MKKKTSEMTIAELRARAAEIRTEVNAEGADLDALEAEADEISQRIAQYETEQRRLGILEEQEWALDCVPGGQMTHTAKKVYYNID